MKPGRELDALVAEKVMGLAAEDWRAPCLLYHTTDDDAWCYNCRILVSEVPGEPPRYSTDIAAAWDVVGHLRNDHWVVHLVLTDEGVSAKLGDSYWVPTVFADSETAPHAICLAALRAVGVEVDDG